MLNLSGDITAVIFNRSVSANLGEVSLDSRMLGVLMELNGVNTVGDIAEKLNKSTQEIKSVLERLSQLNLIEQVSEPAAHIVDQDTISLLTSNLQIAMGPIADVLVDDEVREMGEVIDKFPLVRLAQLVNILARQIPRDEKRIPFQQVMVKKITELIA